MSTKLDRLLENLNSTRTLDETIARTDQALNTFTMPAGSITDWQAFRWVLVQLLRHVEKTVLRLSAPMEMPLDFDWGRCSQFLAKVYGSRSPDQTAFEMARTGNEGGLYRVLKDLATAIAESYAQNEIDARVLTFWNGLSLAEKLEAIDEYLEKFGHLLPSELTEGSAARIRANFWRVLQEHPGLMQRLNRVGRSG